MTAKRKSIPLSVFIFIMMLFCPDSLGQKCGTKIPENYVYRPVEEVLDTLRAADYKIQYVPEYNKPYINLSIAAYVTGDSMAVEYIETAIDSMNNYFEPSGISFSLCYLEHIDDPYFASVTHDTIESRLKSSYHMENVINVYFVDYLEDSYGDAVCGYSYLPVMDVKNEDIFVDKYCHLSITLTHEMGHIFGLLHTHELTYGAEFSDGTNCETTGDLICDTKASPDLSDFVDESCRYTGLLLDPRGDYYWPSVSNLMAYSPTRCRCLFTAGQIQRIIETYYVYKTHLR